MQARLRKAIAGCAMLCAGAMVTGCAPNGPVGGDFCMLTDFIWLSADDSELTVEQVVLHNERREALCGEPGA